MVQGAACAPGCALCSGYEGITAVGPPRGRASGPDFWRWLWSPSGDQDAPSLSRYKLAADKPSCFAAPSVRMLVAGRRFRRRLGSRGGGSRYRDLAATPAGAGRGSTRRPSGGARRSRGHLHRQCRRSCDPRCRSYGSAGRAPVDARPRPRACRPRARPDRSLRADIDLRPSPDRASPNTPSRPGACWRMSLRARARRSRWLTESESHERERDKP
jgi:hypothetical protein